MTNPDVSGMLRFLTDELQAAEDAGDSGEACIVPRSTRHGLTISVVWIMGHVLTGWDGTNPLLNPTDLCKLPYKSSVS